MNFPNHWIWIIVGVLLIIVLLIIIFANVDINVDDEGPTVAIEYARSLLA